MFQRLFSDVSAHSRTASQSAIPGASTIHNADVQPIARQGSGVPALQKSASNVVSSTLSNSSSPPMLPSESIKEETDVSDGPVFNDRGTSDIRIDIVNSQGDLHTSLYLHCDVLKEQSDFFFSSLRGKGGKHGPSSPHSQPDAPPLTFAVHVSKHVTEPEAYVSTFRMFYLEEEDMPEEIQSLGSVWKVLETLIVATDLQFHMCSAACVDYLESVPWNDNEMADIVKLLSSVDLLAECKQVLDRLPVCEWDEDTLSESLRALLSRAVAYAFPEPPVLAHPQGGRDRHPAAPAASNGVTTASTSSASSSSSASAAHPTSARESGAGEAAQRPAAEGSSELAPERSESGRRRAARRRGQLPPGTVECREAAGAILRSKHEPALSLRVKKGVLREAFAELLQGLWADGRGRGEGGGEGEEEDREEALIYGPQGALTWLVGMMLEFSMADEVFKWLATDEEFVSQVRATFRRLHQHGLEAGRHGGHRSPLAPSLAIPSSRPSRPALHALRVALLGTLSALLERRLVANSQLRGTFCRTWTPVLFAICTTSDPAAPSSSTGFGSGNAKGRPGDSGAHGGGTPAEAELVGAADARPAAGEERGAAAEEPSGAFLLGEPLSAAERDALLLGFNQLVLTLPAADQHQLHGNWFRLAHSLPASHTPLPSPSFLAAPLTPKSPVAALSAMSPKLARLLSGGAAGKAAGGAADAAAWEQTLAAMGLGVGGSGARASWFSLSAAYRQWLMRLGSTWDAEAVANVAQ